MKLRLTYLRKNAKLTQKELAEKIGTTASTISKYEQGQLEPSLEMLEKMADLFGVSMDFLLGYREKPTNITVQQSNDADGDHDYLCILNTHGNRERVYIPPEKQDRFRVLVFSAFPELFDGTLSTKSLLSR